MVFLERIDIFCNKGIEIVNEKNYQNDTFYTI